MIDYFALLQQPRRPWLDLEELKQRYQQLTLTSHPDRLGDRRTASFAKLRRAREAAPTFADVNEAYRVLSNPKSRLQHLLELEGIPIDADVVPETLSDVFLETGTLIQEIDRLLAKSTDTALSKALLRSELMEKQKLAADLLDRLKALNNDALQELRVLDEAWLKQLPATFTQLNQLYQRFAYLTRWIDQLEERRFQLSTL